MRLSITSDRYAPETLEIHGDTLEALWCEHTQCYGLEFGAEILTSADGDEWLDENGLHPTSDEFDALTIRLSGGPRDGETVA
jgi:hypothetical protein